MNELAPLSQEEQHQLAHPTLVTQQLKASAKGHNPCSDKYDREENSYLFPPLYLTRSALQHLLSCKAKETLLNPDILQRPYWRPVLRCLYFDSPYGLAKVRQTRKNTQRYYTTKHLIRYIYCSHVQGKKQSKLITKEQRLQIVAT